MPFKPKKGWAKKRMEQTKKTLVLCIPRMDSPPVEREEAGASQMENPPAPQAEGEDPGAGEAQEPWMNRTRHPLLIQQPESSGKSLKLMKIK